MTLGAAPKKETPMAFEPTPNDSLQPIPSPSKSFPGSSSASPPPGRALSPLGQRIMSGSMLSPTSNSQAAVSESPQTRSDRVSPSLLPGNSSTYWFEMLAQFQSHMDAERNLHRQQVEGLRKEISALQAQVQIHKSDSLFPGNRCGSQSAAASGRKESDKAFFPDEETVRRSREGLERIRQPSLERSRGPSPSAVPAPPSTANATSSRLSRLASIDENPSTNGASDKEINGSANRSFTTGYSLGRASSKTMSPLESERPLSPPSTAVASETPTSQYTHSSQRQRRSSEVQHPEAVLAAARAANTMSHDGGVETKDSLDAEFSEAGRSLQDDRALSGPLTLPHNPTGPNSRKSEEFLSALWTKVQDDSQPTVLRGMEVEQIHAKTDGYAEQMKDDHEGLEDVVVDGPVLKSRKSTNFGAPLGSLGDLARR